jgi:hypothetical protein
MAAVEDTQLLDWTFFCGLVFVIWKN